LHELALSSDAINMVINAANTWSTGIKASLGVPVHERAGLAFSRAALFWALSLEMQMEMGVLRYTDESSLPLKRDITESKLLHQITSMDNLYINIPLPWKRH
jgi:hypothetical protein